MEYAALAFALFALVLALAARGAAMNARQRAEDAEIDAKRRAENVSDELKEELATTRALLEACDLEWDPRCLEFHTTERAVSTGSSRQVREPISGRSIGRWRRYAAQLAPHLKRITDPDPAPPDDLVRVQTHSIPIAVRSR